MPTSKHAAPDRDNPTVRRSPCPVACALDLFGDRWTLLIIRDLILGRRRFKEFAESPEGIPTNILSNRLERLLNGGVVRQIPADKGSKRLAYELTEKGLALRPILLTIRDWGLQWEPETKAGMERGD
ncbi:MAG: winged helix-turn-helix transcriptional regulator [Verrucomicrobiales bacterium]|nr:helix-turn-helix transcriptional regulator [Verrucomicrobiae bacterium]MCP5552376.1 helix-turn-helix transcriptional regulator [Akkermansiaceae bacterium]